MKFSLHLSQLINYITMKKLFLGLLLTAFTLSTYSCRETAEEEGIESEVQEVESDLEETGEEVGDEFEETGDEIDAETEVIEEDNEEGVVE